MRHRSSARLRPLRAVVGAATGCLAVATLAGCSMISTQATTIQYAPSDGMNVYDSGPLDVRNVFVVSNADNTSANLVMAVVNSTADAEVLNVDVADGDTEAVRVRAGEVISFGTAEVQPLELGDIGTPAGATVPIYFQSGDGEGKTVDIPVLDGSLPQYAALAPE